MVKPLKKKRFEVKLKKMKLLSNAQAGFIQLELQKIDRRSKPIKKQTTVLDEALRRKRIQLEKDGWDILSLLKKNKDDENGFDESDEDILEADKAKRGYRKRVDVAAIVTKEDQELLKAPLNKPGKCPFAAVAQNVMKEPDTPAPVSQYAHRSFVPDSLMRPGVPVGQDDLSAAFVMKSFLPEESGSSLVKNYQDPLQESVTKCAKPLQMINVESTVQRIGMGAHIGDSI